MKNEICICDTCKNLGWIETFVFSSTRIANGTVVIEKCDECNFFISDSAAAKFVLEKHKIYSFEIENGFNVKIQFSLN